MNKKYNWDLIRAWYVEEKVRNASITLKDVATQFKCSADSVYKKATKEQWDSLVRDRTTSYLARIEYERAERDKSLFDHVLDSEANYRYYMTDKALYLYKMFAERIDKILLRTSALDNMTEADRRDIKIYGDLLIKLSADSQAKVGLPTDATDSRLRIKPKDEEIRSRDELKHRQLEDIMSKLGGLLEQLPIENNSERSENEPILTIIKQAT